MPAEKINKTKKGDAHLEATPLKAGDTPAHQNKWPRNASWITECLMENEQTEATTLKACNSPAHQNKWLRNGQQGQIKPAWNKERCAD